MNKLSFKTHASLLLMAFVTWAIFVVIGLPDYYQSWHPNLKVIVCFAVTALYIPLGAFLIKRMFPDREYFLNSIWLALYLTVPLFTFDIVYIMGFLGEENLLFVAKYWYLTFFYFSFWLQFPVLGLVMERAAKTGP